jgi:hypothetical protein
MLGEFGILGDLGKVLNDFLSVLRLAGTAFTANFFFSFYFFTWSNYFVFCWVILKKNFSHLNTILVLFANVMQ